MTHYTTVVDVEGLTMDFYEQVKAAIGTEPVEGMVVEAVGPTGTGVRIVSIWSSRADQERFVVERLHPAFARLGSGPGGGPTQTDFEARYVVIGPAATVVAP